MRKALPFLLAGIVFMSNCKCKKDEIPHPVSEPAADMVIPKVTHQGSIIRSITANDGSILAFGTSPEDSLLLRKISMNTGMEQWAKPISGADIKEVCSILQINGGDIWVSGLEPVMNNAHVAVAAYDSEGVKKWRKLYDVGTGMYHNSQLVRLSNGRMMLTYTHSPGQGPAKLTRKILDSDGNELSSKSTDLTGFATYNAILQKKNNAIILVGTKIENPNFSMHLVQMDETGEITSENSITKTGADLISYHIAETLSSELFVCGMQRKQGEREKGFVMKITIGLNESGYKLYEDNDKDVFLTAIKTGAEGYTAVGHKRPPGTTERESYLVTTNPDGVTIRERTYTTPNRYEWLENVWIKNQAFVVTANTYTTTPGDQQYYVTGLDKDGNGK